MKSARETPVQFGAAGKLYTWNSAFPARIMAVDLETVPLPPRGYEFVFGGRAEVTAENHFVRAM